MTTTYSTDAQVATRCPLAISALAAVNAALTAASYASTTLDATRVEAQRQIQVALLARGIDSSLIDREADLREPEIALTATLLFEACAQRREGKSLYAEEAAWWRAHYERALESAAPIDGIRAEGRTFQWGRG